MLSSGCDVISESCNNECNRKGCSERAIHCFLMRGEGFNWRLDLCENHSAEFKANPTPDYEGITDLIYYGEAGCSS
jgi:hypothetical protein